MKSAYAVSKNEDSNAAANSAVDECLRKLGPGSGVIAAMVFYGADHDAEAIATTLKQRLSGTPVIGCSTDGELCSDGLSVDSVCLMVLSSKTTTARAAAISELSASSFDAGARLARELRTETSRVLFLLPDGLTGNGSAVIRGAQEVLGPDFVIAGGTAGDRGRFERTTQICNGRAMTDSLPGLMLESDEPLELGFGVMAGWKPLGIGKKVTRAEGNTVYEIEGKAALDVYNTFLGDKASQLPAIGVEYPFALVDDTGLVDEAGMRDGESYILLRAPMVVDHESGAVTFAAEIPQGSTIKMTRGKSVEVVEASREAAGRAKNRLEGPADVVFFFSCMARKIVLGRRTNEEIRAAQEVFGDDVPMAGFYTYGEIANCGQRRPICRFHNETATFLAIRERS